MVLLHRVTRGLVQPLIGPAAPAGFKETAFLYAISSAGLTHALAKACSAGRMERCTCDEAPDLENREAWQWGGCGDNLKYSSKFVKEFLGRRSSKDLRARVDFHNNLVGVKASGEGVGAREVVLGQAVLRAGGLGGDGGHCLCALVTAMWCQPGSLSLLAYKAQYLSDRWRC